MVRRVDLLETLAEHLAGRPPAIGHRSRQLALQDLELLGIVAGRDEVLVEELEPGLEIGRRRAAGNAVARQRNGRVGACQLPGQHLLEIQGLQAAEARGPHVVGRERRLLEVIGRSERRAAGRREREENLVVLERRRLQPGLDPVREPDDRDADVRNLAARRRRSPARGLFSTSARVTSSCRSRR